MGVEAATSLMNRNTSTSSMKDLITSAWRAFREDNAQQYAAAVAFFAILSLAPLLILAIGLSGILFADEAARGEIVTEVAQFVGERPAEAIEAIVANASEGRGGAFASIIGIVALLWGASRIFAQLRIALNKILGIEPVEGGGIGKWVRYRATATAGVLGVGIAILTSVLLTTILSRLQSTINLNLSGGEYLWQILSLTISLAILAGVVTLMFRYIPDRRVPWKAAGVGALATAALFTIGQVLITFYFSFSDVGSAFGASSSMVILIIWIYYSASILFFGAELMEVWAASSPVVEMPGSRTASVTKREERSEGFTPGVTPEPTRKRSSLAGMVAAAGAGGCLGLIGGLMAALAATLLFIVRSATRLFRR